ncbi:AAA family ATPase [Gimesia fumaroli]|uniref:Chromosome segregation protein n=1 Tax=Gimesia fumaroli TaxID=2527976 RepID=A0A518I5T6_9PLAN|nr:AAA family ATPase [Gimesia fumaroli]QDV48457.1 chromosome segregation protein [Gimesia fumaroli]
MKLVAAHIRNFKLLREIDLSFSIDSNKPLTVIRAENGSGKTSTLQALRWALYGKDVLDDPLIRLSPADWPDKTLCEIVVEIDFVHTAVSKVNGETMTSESHFMLKREVGETPDGDSPNRGQERVTLFEKTLAGSAPLDAAESRLAQMLPKEMIDIFFTDGDAALTFISTDVSDSTKRDKVKDAIRSLLGLDLLERVEKRISNTQSTLNRQITRNTSSDQLVTITEKIVEISEQKDELTNAVTTLKEDIENTQRKLHATSRDLKRALEAGSYKQLAHLRENYQKQLNDAIEEEERLKRQHQELFQSESLSWGQLGQVFQKGYDYLDSLHAKGIIPRAAVPVLEERLETGECICGADLSEGTIGRKKVCELLDQQRNNDSKANHLSSLYYQAKSEVEKWASNETKKWSESCQELQEQRVAIKKRIESANRELKSTEAKLDQIDEEEIEQKHSQEKMFTATLRQKNIELDRSEASLIDTEQKLKELNQSQKELRQADEKMAGLNAEKTVLNDLQQVVHGSLKEMQGTYLKRVSDRMNELFLDMVGADPKQNAIFQGAEITSKYSIVVNTRDNRTLNPDYEVNGASQRALTFAFIWALTEVSGVVAPRVIDTPLGMMSGNVKRRVLEMVSKAAGEDVDRQVILFLTQSEISHTEDILDKQSGITFTLVKTDDYPADLMNAPKAQQSEVRLCSCTHREYCDQCQRTNYEDFHLNYRGI